MGIHGYKEGYTWVLRGTRGIHVYIRVYMGILGYIQDMHEYILEFKYTTT